MSKTRMGKRVASLLLSLVMMLSLLPTTVYATGGTGETNGAIVEANTSDDNTVGETTGNPELTGEDEGGGAANVSEGKTATVATIGSATYETLDEAIAAVADGETIVVNAGEYTLNGSLNYTGKAFTIAAAEGAKVSFDMSAAVALHGAKITFNNVTFDYKTNGNYIGLQHADTLVYNNCTINGMVFLYAVNETFNGCTFNQTSAGAYNVWTYGAQNAAFNGCTFNCVGKAVLVYNEGTDHKTDLTVTKTSFNASAPVTGKAAIEIDTSLMKNGGATITVDEQTKAEGFAAGSNSGNSLWNDKMQTADTNKNTTVTVGGVEVFVPKATASAAAQIGETTYETLAAAIAAAKDGETVTLLKDCSGNGIVVEDNTFTGKGLTVDFAGHTYTVGGVLVGSATTGTNAFQLLQGNKITFKNGTIAGVAENTKPAEDTPNWHGAPAIVIQNYCDLTLESMTVSGGDETVYTMSNNCGNVVIENTTINAGKAKGYTSPAVAFGVCRYSSYPSVTVTVKGNSVINGDVEVSGTIGEGQSRQLYVEGGKFTGEFKVSGNVPANITVSGGTFSSAVPAEYCAAGFIPTANADGTYGVQQQQVLAKIGDTAYYTMDAAFHAVQAGETIVMQRDYTTGAEQYSGNESFAINLNGKTWTYTGTNTNHAAFEINHPNVTLTVQNGTVASNSMVGLIPSAMGVGGTITYDNAGLVFENVTMTAKGHSGIETNGNNTNDAVTLKNSTLNVPDGFGIYFPSSGKLTIDNSTINAKTMGVQVCAGSLSINAGSAITVIGDAVPKTENDGAIQDGAAISIVNRTGYKGLGDVTVTGGKFTAKAGNKAIKAYDWANKTETEFTAAEKVAVSGGTFSSAVKEEYCATGYIPVANGDGTHTVKEGAYVAKVDNVKYETLQAAIDAAKGGDIVTLLADATEDVTIDKNITLDLGGKTLTNTGAGKATVTIAKGATATVQNGSIIGGTSYYNIQNNGTATFTGVTATAGNTGSSMIDNFGTLTIESGSYTGGLDTIKNEPGAKLTISGGEFTLTKGTSKGFTGVVFNYGDLTITGGTFTQSDKSAPYGQAQVIHTDNKSGSSAPSTVITGGTFKNLCTRSTAWVVRATNAAAGATKVSGGTFNKSISDGYCADGFIPTKNADGTYGVKAGKYVAQIGSKKYETLADAIRLAAKGKTITLLANVTENVEIAANKNLTLDLNGFTLNGGTGTAKAALYNLGTITIQDSSAAKTGTIKRDDTGAVGETSYYVIRNQGTMTIESGTVINNSGYRKANSTGSMIGSSLICNGDCDEGGTLTIKGGTFTQNNFIAIKNGALGVLHVTGGTITSNHSAIQNWFKADITGGEIKGQLWTDAWKEGESVGETKIGGDAKFSGEIVMDITGSEAPTLAINGGNLNVTNWRITNAAANAGAKPAVSGGTFSSAVKEEYCATGYIPTANADGTYGVKEGVYVAKVDNVKYETLQAAIDAAKGGSTVRLLANVTLTETAVFPAGKTVHLNLVGHNITATGTALRINGTTDIQSTGGVGTIESTGNVAVAVGNNASLTVYSGTLKGREGAVITGTSTGAKIEIKKNATLIATDNAVIAGNGSQRDGKPNTILVRGGTFIGGIVTDGYIACGIYAPWNDNVTVSGGTFNITNGAGIVARAGTVKVTGGTFNCTGTAEGYVGDSKNKVPCAALVFDKAAKYPALTESSQILVSGGSFSTDPAVNGATLADGYVATQTDGMYKVAKADPTAEINGVKYDTLQAAINAAQATKGGATITLLKNINTESYYMVNGDNPVTIDLAGYNITGSGISGLFYVTAKGDLTIKGKGTVTAVEDNGAAMAVWVRSPIAKVTLEGGTYTQQITNTADPHFDLIYVERGNVYVKGGTYKGATPDWTLNCYDEHYQSKEANIEVTGGTFVGFDPANNKAEGENTNFVPAGYVSTKGADGNFVVTEVKVAEVNGVAYATLSEAIAAAKDGDTVKLLRDINTPEISYVISKSLTIDLNGMTVTGSGYDAVFQIDNAGAKVVIKNGKVVAVEQSGDAGKYTMAIWASKTGCEVTLEGLDVSQKITHTDDPQMDMIYASGGTITINSGNFVSGTPAWTLNCNDTSYKNGTAKITVTGGTFAGFDPANNKAEGEGTSFVAAGYVSRMDEDGSYTVVPANAKITVGKRLSIGNDLTITYLVNLTDCTNPWVKFQFYNDDIKGYTTVEVKNYGTATVEGPDGRPVEVFTFDFTGVNPQRMTDTLKATVYAEDASGNVVEYQVADYSVAQYCSNKLAKLGQDDSLRKLIGNLVAYGAAAQVYQNYRTDNLVSTVVSGAVSTDYTDRLSSVTQYTGKVTGAAGVTIKGKTLVLSNTFAVRVYFTVNEGVDIANVSFNVTANGKTDTVNSFEKDEKLGYYYFDYANLNATQLDSEVKFESFVNETGVGDMVTYSVNTYLAKKMPNYDKSSNAYKLMAELFNYGCACTEYASK